MVTEGCWLTRLQSAKKAVIIQDGKRKFHYNLEDGGELVEEYEEKSSRLLRTVSYNLTNPFKVRKWRKKTALGGEGQWDFEPRFVRCDTPSEFQWRIRNLSYPLPTYTIDLDDSDQLCLRTTNKNIPDMKRLKLPIDIGRVKLSHANNTLIITYAKPKEVLQFEAQLKKHLSTVKPIDESQGDCKTT